MRKHLPFILCVFVLLTLCGCSQKQKTDTFFIHALQLEDDNGDTKITCICEKLEGNDEYFTISQIGKSLDDAIEKLTSKYIGCYFATCETYFISENQSGKFIESIASQVCQSNILPTKSYIFATQVGNTDFINNIKDKDDIESLIKSCGDRKTNIIKFFSQYLSQNKASLPKAEYSKKSGYNASKTVTISKEK